MLATRVGRVSLIVVLLLGLGGLGVWYGTAQPGVSGSPSHEEEYLVTAGDPAPGEPIDLEGTVAQSDPVVLAVEYEIWEAGEYETGTVEVRLRDAPAVSAGDHLAVAGTTRADGSVAVTSHYSIPDRNLLYMYLASAAAGLWVLGRLLGGWTLDPATGAIHRREAAISLRDLLRRQLSRGDADA